MQYRIIAILTAFLALGCASGPQIHSEYIASENVAIFQTNAIEADWGSLRAAGVLPLDTLAPTVQLTLYVEHVASNLSCQTWRLALNDATAEGVVFPNAIDVNGEPVISLAIDLVTLAALEVGQAVSFDVCGRKFEATRKQLEAVVEFAARILAALDALRGR